MTVGVLKDVLYTRFVSNCAEEAMVVVRSVLRQQVRLLL
jgi:hypothetical protein